MIHMDKVNTNKKLDAKQGLKDISHLNELPAASFKTDANSRPIDMFIHKYNAELIQYPSLQRNSVWGPKDQEELIESLIRGIPIPPLYMNKCRNKKGDEVWEVLDGRQRITALMDFFVHNMVRINNNLPKSYEHLEGYRYKDIEKNNPLFAGKFASIQLPVVWMDDAPEQLKKEFFQKLNKGGKALSPGELAHSSLEPANKYMVRLMETHFYKQHVHKTQRYAEYVPVSKVVHFILKAKQKDNTFMYNPRVLNGWKSLIVTNSNHIQTDLDDLHEHRNEGAIPYIDAEVDRVCELIDEVLGELEIESPNNNLITNMIISLLILEDKGEAKAMSHDELKQSFEGLVKLWNAGHAPILRQKMKTGLSNITTDEGVLINECDKLESKSKTSLADIMENIRDDTYSNYV